MIDPLAERFFPLEDLEDDSDWLDVRRRARRTKPIVLIVIVAVAVLVAAAALAAADTWVMSPQYGQPTGERTVTFHGHRYTIKLSLLDGGGRFFAMLLSDRGDRREELVASYGGGFLPAADPEADAPAVSPASYRSGGGEIWYGDARAKVARVVVVDVHGRRFTADTSAAQARFGSRFRFWSLALQSSYARTILGYDADGDVVYVQPLYPANLLPPN